MFDIWIGKINLTVLILIFSVGIVLPVQLLLCFKVRSCRLRCMPVIILFLAAAANVIMYIVTSGWKRLVFSFGAVYMVLMMLMCGVGWAVWAVIKRRGGLSS